MRKSIQFITSMVLCLVLVLSLGLGALALEPHDSNIEAGSETDYNDDDFFPAIDYTPGDLDGDGEVTDSDAVYLLFYTFFPEDYPIEQPVDYNGDGQVTDEDAVYLLFYTFFPEDYPLTQGLAQG